MLPISTVYSRCYMKHCRPLRGLMDVNVSLQVSR